MNGMQTVWGVLFAAACTIAFYHRRRLESGLRTEPLKAGRKTFIFEPLMLPVYFFVLVTLALCFNDRVIMAELLLRYCLLFLNIAIYHAVLLLLLPLLRRIISPMACSDLWILPNALYTAILIADEGNKPRFSITVHGDLLERIAWIWAAGFILVLLWQLSSHLFFRRYILRNSAEPTRSDLISRWNGESRRHGIKVQIPVFVSSAVVTPLTIGCFDRTMRLVLPREDYTDKELSLIFSHELRHILRADSRTKMFVGFCTAVGWFNPISWITQKSVSKDLELSCDEAVLEGAYEDTRKEYAELLLKNAGDSRGYTTCLSATASSLRYRLRNVVKPSKRLSGGVVVGLAMFALFMMMGFIAVIGAPGTVQTLVFDKAPEDIYIEGINTYRWNSNSYGHRSVYGWNEGPLTDYIASLQVKQVYAGNYGEGTTRSIGISYCEGSYSEVQSVTYITLNDTLLVASIPYDDRGDITFLLEEPVDWSYVEALLDFDAPDPDPSPQPPELSLDYYGEDDTELELMHAVSRIAYLEYQGEPLDIDPSLTEVGGIGGISGFDVDEVRLYFSYPPAGNFEVLVENWDKTESYKEVFAPAAEGGFITVPLAPYDAHYTVFGRFESYRDSVYEMEFYFDVEYAAAF